MKKYIYSTMAAIALMALTACSSSDGDIIAEDSATEDNTVAEAAATGTITFSIGNATTRSATTRAEIQTEKEREVTKLIAVIFRDLKNSLEESGVTDDESDEETFYEYVEIEGIDEDNPLDSTATYSMKIETDGHFQIIFIANPSDNLIDELDNNYYKGSNLITEFKTFVETQDPSTKPMTMESDHTYGVISAQDTKLGTIHLSRIMSRIDILNLADGITIDSVKFVNRTVKSVLVNDNSSTLNTEYVEEEKMYTMSLVGNHYHTEGVDEDDVEEGTATTDTINAYKWKIYSYEQYGTDDDAPQLVLYYHIGSNTSKVYAHTVKFETTTDGTSTQVNLERNYYYLISVSTSDTGYIDFSIGVADWVDEEELYVSAETISNNAEYIDTEE